MVDYYDERACVRHPKMSLQRIGWIPWREV